MAGRAIWIWLLLGLVATACGHTQPDLDQAPQFPVIDRAALSDPQRRVVDELLAQFDAPQPGTYYAEGADEPWCADFVSWVMNATGQPLDNPNSGAWRIPGVYTMQEYYQAAGRFEGPDYRPVTGDVVLWGEDSPMGLHANIVVRADGENVTTVGGNEGGIAVRTTEIAAMTGLLGYGRLS